MDDEYEDDDYEPGEFDCPDCGGAGGIGCPTCGEGPLAEQRQREAWEAQQV